MKPVRFLTSVITASAVALSGAAVIASPATAQPFRFMSQAYNPAYGDVETAPGVAVEIPLQGSVPAGTTFEISDAPAGWNLSVNAEGTVTAKPSGLYPGSYVQGYVVVTYPDRTVDYALFGVRVAAPSVSLADSLPLTWGNATVSSGGSVTLRPSVDLPEGAKFSAPAGSGGWRVSADQATGEVTVTAPARARAGAGISITIGVIFPDGSGKQYTSRVTVGKAAATPTTAAPTSTATPTTAAPVANSLFYADTPVPAGDNVTVFLLGDLPEGSRVTGPNQTYNGWMLRTDETTGAITFTAPRDAKPGFRLTADVTVLFPDGTSRDLKATVFVPETNDGSTVNTPVTPTTTTPTTTKPAPTPARPAAEIADVRIANATVKAGESIVVTPSGLPAGARVFVREETRGGWTITREGDTGIRITAAKGMPVGSVLRINAAIQFADYSSVNRTFDTTVVRETATAGTAADTANFSFPDAAVAPGKSVTLNPVGSVARGTTFTVGQVPAGWNVSINRTTGRLTVRAPRTAGETATFPVTAKFKDGSTRSYTVTARTTAAPVPPVQPAPPAPSDAGATVAKVIGGLVAATGLLGILGGVFGGFIPFF